MARKVHDLAVVVGTYFKDGQEKKRYQNIGVMMENDQGGRFLILEPWFNPAGVPHENGKGIMVSMFDNKPGAETPEQGRSYQTPERPARPPAQYKPEPSLDGFSDDIPF